MLSLADPRVSNPILSILQVKPEDEIIAIEETSTSDANFILTHLLKQIFHENNRVCMVCFHEPVGHYQAISRKLGFDLNEEVKNGRAAILDLLYTINDDLDAKNTSWLLSSEKDELLLSLIERIKHKIDDLNNNQSSTYLIIDDLSHLLDLGVNVNEVIEFTNFCLNLNNIKLIINVHVTNEIDKILSNNLQYNCDLFVNVAPLKTGHSNDVTGFIHIKRNQLMEKRSYHYKTYDRGIKTFQLGEAIYHLRK